jgi:shikimate kinase
VVSCGGGIVENALNFLYFQKNSKKHKIIYLETNEKILLERILSREGFDENNAEHIYKNLKDMIETRVQLLEIFAEITIKTNKLRKK